MHNIFFSANAHTKLACKQPIDRYDLISMWLERKNEANLKALIKVIDVANAV